MAAKKILSCMTIFVAAVLTACSNVEFDKGPPANPSASPVVCDPLGGGTGGGGPNRGLVADLHFLEDDDRAGKGVPDRFIYYIDWAKAGNHLLQHVFMNQLYVPSRKFENGFQNQSGDFVKKTNGEKLVEYFALDFKSNLGLAGKAPGAYQFGVISDDGAIVTITDTNNNIEVINQDGYNSSRFGCSTQPITFSAGEKKPFRLRYFQSPRTHIALVMMWRPWQGGSSPDPLCGKQGTDFGQDANNFFFNTNDPSSPATNNFNDLKARGWQVIAPEHFTLPDGVTNPCS
jgi:hypothetical protein